MKRHDYPAKRLLDLLLVGIGLPIALPLTIVLALIVRVRLGGPVLFRQARAGRSGREFTLIKFRTMTDERDSRGTLLSDGDRLTPFGVWLRRTSLDEIPSIWNVLLGDMSLVGPRPLHVRYLSRYSRHQARRHDVRPGVTGLAQVNGRNARTWEEKFDLDVQYVERCSLSLDIQILIRTIRVVFQQRDVSQAGHPTAEEFVGPR